MSEGFSVWYYSNEILGNIQECECEGVDLATATRWFIHHTTNVTARTGLTKRVIVVDSDDCIVAEWKHGESAMIEWEMLHPYQKMTTEQIAWRLGYLPYFLSEADPRSAREQLNANYKFGGWRPFPGFELGADNSLNYPGDPPEFPLAQAKLRDELIVLYPHDWVAVIQPDRSFEVCRMD